MFPLQHPVSARVTLDMEGDAPSAAEASRVSLGDVGAKPVQPWRPWAIWPGCLGLAVFLPYLAFFLLADRFPLPAPPVGSIHHGTLSVRVGPDQFEKLNQAYADLSLVVIDLDGNTRQPREDVFATVPSGSSTKEVLAKKLKPYGFKPVIWVDTLKKDGASWVFESPLPKAVNQKNLRYFFYPRDDSSVILPALRDMERFQATK